MRTLILVLVGFLVLTGCAKDPQVIKKTSLQQEKIYIPPNKSLLYIVRPSRYGGSANRYKISIKGRHAADMATGTYFSYLVPSGNVDVSADTVPSILNFGLALAFMGKPKLTLTTIPGKIYFVNVGVSFSGGPTLTNVKTQVGEPLIKKTKKIEAIQGQ